MTTRNGSTGPRSWRCSVSDGVIAPARYLPYGRQTIDDDDIAAVVSALQSDFLTTGPLVDVFERDFAHATGAAHAVVCNSGTAALHLAMLALDCGPGDAVIVPTMTFLATANAARMTRADVMFADVDAQSGLMTPQTFGEALDRAAGRRIKAALPVHLNGQLCAMLEIRIRADSRQIALVEDACHALGVPSVGATRDSWMACFSTHPVKAITTGEGGVVTTADSRLAERMRRLRNHAMVRDTAALKNTDLAIFDRAVNPWYYEIHELGWNYRQPDVLCALGVSQLKKLDRFHRRRVEIAAIYDRLLAPLAPILQPIPRVSTEHGWHLYVVLIDFAQLGVSRATFMKQLQHRGIGTQVHYLPVHRHPYYQQLYGNLDLPGADAYYARCLSIPMFPEMSDVDVHTVATALSMFIRGTTL
jgi:UDP-4-amino-4,6-dideoxy-N-acetyl-beta-L-altrosamine transaminase